MSKKANPRQQAFIILLWTAIFALLIFVSWKAAAGLILADIVVVQLKKLVTGKGLFE